LTKFTHPEQKVIILAIILLKNINNLLIELGIGSVFKFINDVATDIIEGEGFEGKDEDLI